MTRTLAMLHTVAGHVPTFQQLCQEIMPVVETFHMVDESLLKNTIRSGRLTPETTRRVLGHVASAVDAGADAVLVTCSSIGPAVALSRADCPMANGCQSGGAAAPRTDQLRPLAHALGPAVQGTCRGPTGPKDPRRGSAR